ncbi:TetR/AcrR family transcriptional regulator [Paracoccus sp. SCSIO 75233]|uniref:TetR/AcrR family transcriptional regulator n=1 Tax=Paracoccus sp. SCSIO 75233 TaxID=3017782 RepID=UPI0022F0AB97|nr:TetR/AcrR family transcriptional regulator [Paracoccus sp. SCSIO 75233]WBU53024.1 TetR/AcrR family transcriptional regulator [Paracoccus sp. SCSIO 75233]
MQSRTGKKWSPMDADKPVVKRERPQRADGEATRNRILDAAGQLIAARGRMEATNTLIAAEAGVDLASINYHFGNRDGLYQAVLAEAHRRVVDRKELEELAKSDLPARDKLKKVIALMIARATAEAHWPMVVLGREVLSPTTHIQVLQRDEIFPKLEILQSVLSEITSIPVDDPALWRCLPSVAAPCAVFLLLGQINSPLSKNLFSGTQDEIVEHLYQFALGGLENVARLYQLR